MIEGLFWHMVSLLLVLPAALGMYLVFSPKDSLVVRYQNFMLSWTARPLKDEDFQGIYRIMNGVKVFGFLLIGTSAYGFYMLVQ